MRRMARSLALVAAATLVVTGCGRGEDSGSDEPKTAKPVEVEFPQLNATLEGDRTARPRRTPRFGPTLPTRKPPGIPPRSAPAPYVPSNTPASSFVRS